MTLALLLACLLGVALAAANGANDVSKGVATLAGGGVAGYRRVVAWGTAWTVAGAIAGGLWGGAMLATFAQIWSAEATTAAALATIAGAAGWVALATVMRLPVSTTHALAGALVGVGCVAFGTGGVRWALLGWKVALPLVCTPLIGALAAAMLGGGARLARRVRGRPLPSCACVGPAAAGVPPLAAAFTGGGPTVQTGMLPECAVHPGGVAVTVDHLHWLTSAGVSFARGLNDGPKLAVLMFAVPAFAAGLTGHWLAFGLVAAGMAVGSWFAGRRITRVLAEDVTEMDSGSGFGANLATAGLVGAGAIWGLPMSTTHVSTGAIIGSGVARGDAAVRWRTVGALLLAWTVTLPTAGAFGLAAYGVIRLLE